MENKKMKKCYRFAIAFCAMVLCLTMFSGCSFTMAWFSDKTSSSSEEIPIATISMETYIYNTSNREYEVMANNAGEKYIAFKNLTELESGLIKVKNTSSIPVLLRIGSVSIGVDSGIYDNHGNVVGVTELTPQELSVGMSSNWIYSNMYQDETNPTSFVGSYYYNIVIEPQEEVAFITSISFLDFSFGDTVYVNFVAEAIAYENNPYKSGTSNKPWTDIPGGWNAYL